jgi:hypothetical protein
MWLGGMDLPEHLLEARRSDNLVIFAGAGISAPRPSRLPTFGELVAMIEAESGQPRRKSEPLDVFLGRVDRSEYQVHDRAEHMIGSARPVNALHKAIVGLFTQPTKLRVVTTNFDRLLSQAAEAQWPGRVQEYVAPALPLGDDMMGIVYLHGAVGNDPSKLVLTDADFGRAYLTQGHARRFLVELFSNNAVLFIGYSHRDTVLTYLARGLPPSVKPRFALVHQSEVERWEALSITPLVHPTRRGRARHFSILEPLSEWGRYLQMGFDDHRRRVAEIVQGGSSADRQSEDYLRARISDPDTVMFFCEAAIDTSWVDWMSREPVFQRMLTRSDNEPPTEVEGALANWFGEKFASDHAVVAIGTVARLGGSLSRSAWMAVATKLWIQRPSAEHLAAWLPVLFRSCPDQTNDLLDYLLAKSRPGDDDALAVALFDFLTDPLPVPRAISGAFTDDGRETVSVDMEVRGDAFWLPENYAKVFKGRVGEFALRLLGLVTHHLGKAHDLYQMGGSATANWDPTSFNRSAIEDHEQDQHGLREWWDVLIDAGRDSVEWAVANNRTLARSFIDQWGVSSAPLLRRLAVHAISAAPWMTEDERLVWLIENHLLYSTPAHHEVYRLLEEAYPLASEPTRGRLLAVVDEGSSEPRISENPDLAARVKYDLLQWLSGIAPNDRDVQQRLSEISADHPEFLPSPRPDLLSWMEAGVPEEQPSLGEEEQLTVRDPAQPETLEMLVDLASRTGEDTFEFRSPRLLQLQNVSSAAATNPEWGIRLAQALHDRREWDTELWQSLAEAWSRGSLNGDLWARALELLRGHENLSRHARAFAKLLEDAIRSSPPLIPVSLLELAESVATRLWEELVTRSAAPPESVDDWLEIAINDPAGQVATFFLHALSVSRAEGHVEALDRSHRALFQRMLEGESYSSALARAILASQTHFLISVDRRWTLDFLVPVMDWSVDPERARQAWDGFLSWGQLTTALVNELIPVYESTFEHLADMQRLRDRFTEHLSVVAFLSSANPVGDGWLLRFVQRAAPQDVAAWTRHVTHQLRSMNDQSRESAWTAWMKPYWKHRIEGQPRPLSADEAQRIAEWPLQLPTVFAEAVELVCAGPSAGAGDLLIYNLAGSDYPERYPAAVVEFMSHVLARQARPFQQCNYAIDIADRTRAASSPVAFRRLVNELLRLQCRIPDEFQVNLSL